MSLCEVSRFCSRYVSEQQIHCDVVVVYLQALIHLCDGVQYFVTKFHLPLLTIMGCTNHAVAYLSLDASKNNYSKIFNEEQCECLTHNPDIFLYSILLFHS